MRIISWENYNKKEECCHPRQSEDYLEQNSTKIYNEVFGILRHQEREKCASESFIWWGGNRKGIRKKRKKGQKEEKSHRNTWDDARLFIFYINSLHKSLNKLCPSVFLCTTSRLPELSMAPLGINWKGMRSLFLNLARMIAPHRIYKLPIRDAGSWTSPMGCSRCALSTYPSV